MYLHIESLTLIFNRCSLCIMKFLGFSGREFVQINRKLRFYSNWYQFTFMRKLYHHFSKDVAFNQLFLIMWENQTLNSYTLIIFIVSQLKYIKNFFQYKSIPLPKTGSDLSCIVDFHCVYLSCKLGKVFQDMYFVWKHHMFCYCWYLLLVHKICSGRV